MRKFFVCLSVLAYLSPLALCQTSLQGIKIMESSFDPTTKAVKLVFINDSALDITAWSYCVHAVNAPGFKTAHGFCTLTDSTELVITERIEHDKRPWTGTVECEGCSVIHPGQSHVLESRFDRFDAAEVMDTHIEVTAVVFSDGSFSANTEKGGQRDVHRLALSRHDGLEIHRRVVEIGAKILNDPNDDNPAVTMLAALQRKEHLNSRDPQWREDDSVLALFKAPKWREGNSREYIPDDQRAYVRRFVAEHQIIFDYYRQQQIREEGVR